MFRKRGTVALLVAAGAIRAGHAQEPPPPAPAPTDTAAPGTALRTSFLPTADLRVFTNGNVNVVGDSKQSAVGASVGLSLPVTLIKPRSSWSAHYSTGRQIYGGRHDRANDLPLALSTSYHRTVSRRSGFGVNLAGSRSQQQGYDATRPDQVTTLVPRTDVTRLNGGVSANFASGSRSHMSFGLSGGFNRYGDIPEGELDPEPDPNQPPTGTPSRRLVLVNSVYGGGHLGWGMAVSQRTTIGLGYAYNRIVFEDIDPAQVPPPVPGELPFVPPRDTTVHNVYFNGTRTFGPYTSGNLQLGALAAQQEGLDDRVEPSISASMVRQVSQESSLSFGLRQRVGAGNGRSDASLDRGLFGSWNWSRLRMSGNVALGYWDRATLHSAFGSGDGTRTFQMAESFGWTPGLRFSYGVFHSFRDQQADDVTLEAKGYHSGGLFVRWNIRGRSTRVG